MLISRRGLVRTAAALPLAGRARAQGGNTLRVGVLTDLSGPYQNLAGPLAVRAARLATEDFGMAGKGFTVEILQADHQNKADVGAGVARQWFDEGVDAVVLGRHRAHHACRCSTPEGRSTPSTRS